MLLNKQTTDTCNMDKSQKSDAEQKKPDTKVLILCDSVGMSSGKDKAHLQRPRVEQRLPWVARGLQYGHRWWRRAYCSAYHSLGILRLPKIHVHSTCKE